jgi:hypothetical protein
MTDRDGTGSDRALPVFSHDMRTSSSEYTVYEERKRKETE